MQGWDTRSIIRTCINGLVLVLLLSACNLQPPSLKTTPSDAQGATTAKSKVSWIPQDVYYQKGSLPAGANFKIQDYPQDCGGNICSVTALSASMSWPSIGSGSTSASISLGNANNYVYGFKVLEWGKKDNGERIATLVQMGMSAYAGHEKPEAPYLRRQIGSPYMYFTSTNGINYSPTHTYAGDILGSFGIYSVENITGIDPSICQLVQSSGSGAKINPSLTLDPQGQKGTVSFSLTASNVLNSGLNWRVVNPDVEPPLEMCVNTGAIGGASASMSMTVRIPFIKEVVDTITVSANPAQADPKGSPSKIKVEPSNPGRNWTLKAKAKKMDESCSFEETTLASGQGKVENIPFGTGVPDGEYDLIAEYDDANAPKEPGQTTVMASSEVAFAPGGYVVTFGLPVPLTFTIKQPICPKGKITLVSGALRSTVPGSQEVTCQSEDFGTAGSTFTWDGICQGPNGDVSGIGSVHFKLEAAGKSDTATVSFVPEETGPTPPNPTPRPAPTAKPACTENCPPPEGPSPEPTKRPCPEGAICRLCGISGCGSPKPSDDPNVPSPESICPPLGICPEDPTPDTCSGNNCPPPPVPSACPPGAICKPGPSPTPYPESDTCPTGYVYVPKIDANGQQIQGECDYCPKDFFAYDFKQKMCYVEMGFEVRHEGDLSADPVERVTFSPRDSNGIFDRVIFGPIGDTHTFPGIKYVKWEMELKSRQDPDWTDGNAFLKNEGTQRILYNGWQKDQTCLIDGKYTSQFIPVPRMENQSNPHRILVQVPGFAKAVPTTIFMEKRDTVLFYVDNTPPVVKNLVINERLVDAQAERYKTDISFTVVDPVVNESGSTLPDKPSLEAGALQIFIDDAPFYTSPAVDADGFWIANRQLPQNLENWMLTKSSPSDRQAQVSFSLPYRLAGHTLEVEINDTVANTGRYILYPQGGN